MAHSPSPQCLCIRHILVPLRPTHLTIIQWQQYFAVFCSCFGGDSVMHTQKVLTFHSLVKKRVVALYFTLVTMMKLWNCCEIAYSCECEYVGHMSHLKALTTSVKWSLSLTSVCCVFIYTEVMWLRVWSSAGRVQRSARFYSCDSMWRHTWTGKNHCL